MNGPIVLPPIRRERLDNGLQVVVAERQGIPLAAARLVLRGGREGDALTLRDDHLEAVVQPLAADGGQRDGTVHRAASGSRVTTQRRDGSRYSVATRRTSAGVTRA